MSDELPVGWSACTLGDIVESIETGKSVKCDERPPLGEENGLVKISAVTWGTFNEQESKTLFDSSHLKPEEKIQLGDFLISRANTLELVGSCVLVKQLSKNLYLSDKVLRLVLADESKPWLLTCLRTKNGRKQIESLATGNQLSMRNISQQALKEIRIPLPPLAEQTRIAQKLDELLAQVDTLKARINAIPALLKRFRQSVLAAAVSGRLTEEWRTHQPIEATLNELPAGWTTCCFGDLCNILHGYAFQSEFFADTGPVVLTPGNFTEDGKIDFTTKRVVRLRGDYDPKWMLHNGDLLIVMTDLSPKKLILGKTVKLQSGEVVLHNQRIGKIVPNSNLVFSDYLRIALLESRTKQTIDETATGTVVQHTSPKKILAIKTSLPPLAEQTEIVRRVEQLFAFADQLEAKVASAKSRIDHLTQSILAKAFRGELVPQDPNDEPASVLLERIQAQRAAAPKAKRGRKASA